MPHTWGREMQVHGPEVLVLHKASFWQTAPDGDLTLPSTY